MKLTIILSNYTKGNSFSFKRPDHIALNEKPVSFFMDK